jgi:pyridinium-3,5-biscarboxylic acid mononucleotide synthase
MLERHSTGDLDTDALVAKLAHMPYANLGFARVDHHREVRTGFPEVVFGQGKTPEQAGDIAGEILSHGDRLLITRATPEMQDAVVEVAADAVFEPVSRTISVDRRNEPELTGKVSVVSAGTADLPVAMEAVVTARMMDRNVQSHFDVGVAGLHRLLDQLETLRRADAIVAVAGMDGVLPSVLAGLVSTPVIAVPTSVGYGASFDGVGPLLTMLNACAPGVAVVNIDNGFGAGYMAAEIAKKNPFS